MIINDMKLEKNAKQYDFQQKNSVEDLEYMVIP